MTPFELYGLIDYIARSHPPGRLRLTPWELVEWLGLVAANPKASREVRRDARRAARAVPRLITGRFYEMPNYAPPPAELPPPAPPAAVPAKTQPGLFDDLEDES